LDTLLKLLVTAARLGDGQRRASRLFVFAEEGDVMPIASGIDADSEMLHGVIDWMAS